MASTPWPPGRLLSLEAQLDALVDAVANPGNRSDDEQMWLTRFLVVRACGYLEQVVHEVSIAHVTATSGGTARSFGLSWLGRSRNPSVDKLVTLIGRFDAELQSEFERWLDADDGHIRRELSLLVQRRHDIAHGLNEGMGSRKVVALAKLAKDIADWFILELNPDAKSRRRGAR